MGGGSSATINFTAPNSVLQLDYYPYLYSLLLDGLQSGDVIQFFSSLWDITGATFQVNPSFPGLGELTITAAGGLSETYGLGSLFPGEGISFSYNGGIPTVTLTGPSQDVWVGGSSSWTNGSNWSEGSPPTSTTDAFIDPTTPVTASINAGVTATAYTVSLGAGNSIKLKGGTIESTVSIAAGAMLTGFGTISGPVENSGTVLATGGDLNIEFGIGGQATIAASATLELGGSEFAGSEGSVTFTAPSSVLKLDYAPSDYTLSLDGLQSGDVIQFSPAWSITGATLEGDALSITSAVSGYDQTFGLGSTFPGEGVFFSDSGGIPTVTVTAPDIWTGTNASWTTKSDWSLGSLPSAIINATIDPAVPATVSIPSTVSATAASLSVGLGDEIKLAGTLTLDGTLDMAQPSLLMQDGTLNATSTTIEGGSFQQTLTDGSISIIDSPNFSNEGTYDLSVGKNKTAQFILDGNVTGTGSIGISGPMTLKFIGADSNAIVFGAASGTLSLENPDSFTGVLYGLAAGDIIDLPGVSPAGVTAVLQGNYLFVESASQPAPLFQFALGSTFIGEGFSVMTDSSGGLAIRTT